MSVGGNCERCIRIKYLCKRSFIALRFFAEVSVETADDVSQTVLIQFGCVIYIAIHYENFLFQNGNIDVVAIKPREGIFCNRNNAGGQGDFLLSFTKRILCNGSKQEAVAQVYVSIGIIECISFDRG